MELQRESLWRMMGWTTTKPFRWLLVTHLKKFIIALSITTEQCGKKPMVFPAERIQYGTESSTRAF